MSDRFQFSGQTASGSHDPVRFWLGHRWPTLRHDCERLRFDATSQISLLPQNILYINLQQLQTTSFDISLPAAQNAKPENHSLMNSGSGSSGVAHIRLVPERQRMCQAESRQTSPLCAVCSSSLSSRNQVRHNVGGTSPSMGSRLMPEGQPWHMQCLLLISRKSYVRVRCRVECEVGEQGLVRIFQPVCCVINLKGGRVKGVGDLYEGSGNLQVSLFVLALLVAHHHNEQQPQSNILRNTSIGLFAVNICLGVGVWFVVRNRDSRK